MMHLTEDQIDELLMGSLPTDEIARMREHAAGCEACAAKLAEIEAPIASFKAVTLAWSERRSATMPVWPKPVRAGARWTVGLAWGALAAAALLAAVIPVLRHEQNVRVQQAYRHAAGLPIAGQLSSAGATVTVTVTSANAQDASAGSEVPENPQEIASDNQMLAMVDEELNAPIPASGLNVPATKSRGQSRSTTQGSLQN
jgi:anti-sigma factor RsiW